MLGELVFPLPPPGATCFVCSRNSRMRIFLRLRLISRVVCFMGLNNVLRWELLQSFLNAFKAGQLIPDQGVFWSAMDCSPMGLLLM